MIGNDVVDLKLAQAENNWKRKGFLNKIFTENEQILIQKQENQEIAIWNLWSRKEAAYKIWNRETGIRKYNPIEFECFDFDLKIGKVQIEKSIYFTKTIVNQDFIYSIAVTKFEKFNNILILDNSVDIQKKSGIPFYIDKNQEKKPVSKSHHGKFEFIITLCNS